ncbi:hypothetical protein KW841_24820 [Pseudomonas sp. PDM28]|uniref:hypothetical protein n=1 Tax=Pseudomonas sp. PDM28 TaxID=2854770 RepID=UPI001C4704E0|nr:hypothetical protein [Pseudomonas sp. PDM28]MBV7555576.1 hypothetical protein [Pseudomonas sp. PDM28]
MELIEGIDLALGVKPTARLIEHLSNQSLYVHCGEQILDACRLLDQCAFRIQANESSYLNSLCLEAVRQEESIFQYADTPRSSRLADWIRHFTCCESASDEEAYAAYAMACAVKAIESLSDWMQASEQDVVSKNWRILELPWEEFCQAVSTEINPDGRVVALESYVAHLEVVTSLISLYDNDITELASAAIKTAIRRKGGILSGKDRNEEMSARDTAIVKQANNLRGEGLPRRNLATHVHRWLEDQIALPPKQRPTWLPSEIDRALTRRQVDAILSKHDLL